MLQTTTIERGTLELLKKFDTHIDLCCGKPFNWKKIERRIREMVKFENKIFETAPI